MKQLRIKDNSQIEKEAFYDVATVAGRIADKTLRQLELEGVFVFPGAVSAAGDITEDQMILQSVNDTYRTGNIMGFFGCGGERLVIGSRFCSGEDDYFFRYILARVLNTPNIVDMETDADRDMSLFNLLIFLFPAYLRAAMRKGLFKTYIRRRYNDANVKGTIEIARHISKNTPFVGSVAYSRREYSYDNYLMELVRHSIEHIKKKPYGKSLLIKAKDEVNLVMGATNGYELYDRQKIVTENKHNTVRHAYYREYRALQNLCLLILQHQGHRIGAGSRRVYGILFDGAWLWEEYVNLLVGDLFYHPMNKSKKGKQYLFPGGVGEIYPDFIGRSSEPRIIADAKYKPYKNIKGDDYHQILSYMIRFSSKVGYYFYPEAGEAGDSRLWLNEGSTYEKNVKPRKDICVTKHGLKIPPKASDYGTFVSEMQKSESVFRETLAIPKPN